jgi:hypothetical protein
VSARGLCAGALLFLLLVPANVAARPPQDPEAEQRRALEGLNGGPVAPEDQEMGEEPNPDTEMVPDQHAVAKGDTLWDICETYFHDPWRWPKVWALNPDITNPHWIFPGQTLKLAAVPRGAPVAPADAAPRKAGRSAMHAGRNALPPPPTGTDGTLLREIGFVDTKELSFAGTINGSREEKIMLASGDHAYVEFTRERPMKVGERFTVYQVDTEHPVRDPHSSITLGYLVRIYGDVSIDALSDRPIASGTLLGLTEPVERGYKVGPLFRQFRSVKPRTNAVATTARVVAAVQPNLLIVEGMFVLLDRGSRHGVEVGNRFTIIRQGDGYHPVVGDWDAVDPRFPPDAVAVVLAVDVRDEVTVGWVSGGDRPIHIGDAAEMRKGH